MRLRPRTKQFLMFFLLGLLVAFLISTIAAYFGYDYLNKLQQNKIASMEDELTQLRQELKKQQEETVSVWIATEDIEAGMKLDSSMLTMVQLPKDIVPVNVVPANQAIGKYTKIPVKKQTPILESMLFEEGITPNDLRSNEYRVIELPSDLNVGDFVDVRIVFPDGQDFIVMSKKKVMKLAGATVWHEVNELEILRMSSAIVDAYVNNATIYAVKYVDPYVQKAAEVTYAPNEKVLELIASDPNIIPAASVALEKRVRQKLEKDLKSLDPEHIQKYVSGRSGQNAASITPEPATDTGYQTQNPPVYGAYPTSSISNGTGSSSDNRPQPSPDRTDGNTGNTGNAGNTSENQNVKTGAVPTFAPETGNDETYDSIYGMPLDVGRVGE